MQDISVVLFGMSHANAIKRASVAYVPSVPRVRITVPLHGNAAYPGGLVVYDAAGNPMITPLLQRAVDLQKGRKDKPAVWIVSALGGNEANRLALFAHPEAFDFVDPAEPDASTVPGSRVLPHALVEAQMLEKLGWVKACLELTARMGVAGVIQLGPIPPMRSADEIKARLPDRTMQAARERGASDDVMTINDAAARRRMWRVEAAVTRQICERAGVHYLPLDNALIGPDGMRGADSAGDAIHGNDAWGAEVLRQIEAFVLAQENTDGN